MPYVITTAAHNSKTHATHFASTAGAFMNQVAHLGSEPNSTLLRGYLLAAINGLNKLENLLGRGRGEAVELLIPDEEIAEQFRKAEAGVLSKILHCDNQEFWEKIIARKSDYNLKIVSHPDEGTELAALWRHQHPPL